jgi:hypothetical protein
MPLATTRGGTHWKQAVSPGMMVCMCPDTASSLTPDSIQVWFSSRHTWSRQGATTIYENALKAVLLTPSGSLVVPCKAGASSGVLFSCNKIQL